MLPASLLLLLPASFLSGKAGMVAMVSGMAGAGGAVGERRSIASDGDVSAPGIRRIERPERGQEGGRERRST